MWAVFAEESTGTSAGTVVIVFGMVIASVSALWSTLFAWLAARDKLRYDAKLITMETNITILQGQIKECRDDRDESRDKADRVERELREEIREMRDHHPHGHRPQKGAPPS